MNRMEIAKELKMSQGHLSDILNGKRPCGKATAKKLGKVCDRDWTDFLKMKASDIENTLYEFFSQSEVAA